MKKSLYIITGASRGIGQALSRVLLDAGHTVIGSSRRTQNLGENYIHHAMDLSQPDDLMALLDVVETETRKTAFDFLCLVNNASATEPMTSIQHCPSEDIQFHVQVGLVSPMILTARFMERFASYNMRKRVAFMSSGAAHRAMPDMSVYCTSKAGLLMFGQSIALEQENMAQGFEVVSIGPGMVDTDMQTAARSKTDDEFSMASYFKAGYADGKVQNPRDVALKIQVILDRTIDSGVYVSVADI